MKRPLLIALLTLGTLGGFGHGFATLRHHHHQRRAHFERHVAHVCLEAAREAPRRPPPYQPPPHHGRHHGR